MIIIFFKRLGEGVDIRVSQMQRNILDFLLRVDEHVHGVAHPALYHILLWRDAELYPKLMNKIFFVESGFLCDVFYG